MKKKILSMTLALCLTLGSAAALPQGVFTDNTFITATAETEGLFEYTILDSGSAMITKYNGMADNVTIPETLGGKPVKLIGENAFYKNENIVTVKAPSTLVNISSNAFAYCSKLKKIENLKNSKLTYINNCAFYECGNLQMKKSDFPSSIAHIGALAFYKCPKLEGIDLSNAQTIEGGAFEGCTSLTSIEAPKVTNLGASVFKDCENLQSVTLSKNLKTLTNRMFQGCRKLKNFSIPKFVTSIGDYCLYNCDNYTYIEVPPCVTNIGEYALGWRYFKTSQVTGSEQITDAIYCYEKSRAATEKYVDAGYGYQSFSVIVIDCNHTYEDEVTKEATCTESGVMTHICSQCLDKYTTEIPALGHDWSEWKVTTPATEEKDGVETRTCNRCGEVETRPVAYVPGNVIDKVNFTITEPKVGQEISYMTTSDDPDLVNAWGIIKERRRRGRIYLWYEDETALNNEDTNIFKAGKTYTAVFSIHPVSEKDTFSDKLKVTVNGKPVDDLIINSDYASFSISYTLDNDFIIGDVNGDGVINVADISKVAAHVKGKKLLTEEQQKRADVNGDGKITVTDITKIAAHVKGKKLLS
ncbi:leucine-rich repeat protein [Ruminococcus albus]|uniref:Leucine rich repeat-containing protein n=1 Tax=Ruminococcus albus TaxID=1264 RepID=A0A1I1M1J7_RUMAL|nr:leucine-rich repeat protein [Ruminococcus albus]SFC79259.1 Leucine rich repeat-containing protein [Ruminococcus albus]